MVTWTLVDRSGDLEKSSTEDTSASSMVNVSDSVKLWGGGYDCIGRHGIGFQGYALIQNPSISEEVLSTIGVRVYGVPQNHLYLM